MDANREELQTKVAFSRLCQDMLKVLQNYISKIGIKDILFLLIIIIFVVVLYLSSVKIQINEKTNHKSHSLKLDPLFTLN